jgi:hypothetical protein
MGKDDLINDAVHAYVQAGKRGLDLIGAMQCVVELVAEVEREACAKLCDEQAYLHNTAFDPGKEYSSEESASLCALAIRKRSNVQAVRLGEAKGRR